MHWILQSNLYEEQGWNALLAAITRAEMLSTATYSIHKVIPFVGLLDPEPELPPGRVIVMGSYSLARAAQARGWTPGAFLDNLDFTIQREHWGNQMLNADALVVPFAEVPFQEYPFFLRPVHDTKSFTGLVTDWGDYCQWRDNLIRCPETNDPANDPLGVSLHTVATPTMICIEKQIFRETRVWIVDGEVITYSGYKDGTLKRYTPPGAVYPDIVEYAQRMAEIWSPNRAYVMDIAETPYGLRIVEINNLNSSGFYKGDMNKLVSALEMMS